MHPAFLYLAGSALTVAELTAARIDGDLFEIGDGYIPADLVEARSTRASSIAHLIPIDTAASGPSAAWIHGAGDAPPAIHHVRRAVERRIRSTRRARIVLHDTSVASTELEVLGGVLVMTPARTMVDLALGLHRDESLMRWLVLLSEVDETLIDAAIRHIERLARVPGTKAAHAALVRTRSRIRMT
nr:type IV toxin-antitoxin system AbiEi family antitoxin [Microbacterium hydrocarbonoxydans]